MADLEERVDNLEKEVSNMKLELNTSLSSIQNDVSIIKEKIMGNNDNNDLKNELLVKDIKSNETRIEKLESNQSKVVWAIILEVIGAILAAVGYYFKNS